MKRIIFTGKGGVGKTTILSTLSRMLARDGYKVLAIDCDPA
jgi:CO dehydrogenase maturation factor